MSDTPIVCEDGQWRMNIRAGRAVTDPVQEFVPNLGWRVMIKFADPGSPPFHLDPHSIRQVCQQAFDWEDADEYGYVCKLTDCADLCDEMNRKWEKDGRPDLTKESAPALSVAENRLADKLKQATPFVFDQRRWRLQLIDGAAVGMQKAFDPREGYLVEVRYQGSDLANRITPQFATTTILAWQRATIPDEAKKEIIEKIRRLVKECNDSNRLWIAAGRPEDPVAGRA